MFGKIFTQMYDGTLGTEGPWQALVTFQQMIVLADKTGTVDMTAEAIARRTTIPLDVVRLGLVALERPDKSSRSPDEDGRRITRLSESRDWGWRVVNYAKYRTMRNEEERREYHRAYWHGRKKKDVSPLNDSTETQQTQPIAVSSKQKQVKATPVRAFALPDWLPQNDWEGFVEMRIKIRAPMTDRAKALIVTELTKLKTQGHDPAAALRQSIEHSWRGVFPPKSRDGTKSDGAWVVQ